MRQEHNARGTTLKSEEDLGTVKSRSKASRKYVVRAEIVLKAVSTFKGRCN